MNHDPRDAWQRWSQAGRLWVWRYRESAHAWRRSNFNIVFDEDGHRSLIALCDALLESDTTSRRTLRVEPLCIEALDYADRVRKPIRELAEAPAKLRVTSVAGDDGCFESTLEGHDLHLRLDQHDLRELREALDDPLRCWDSPWTPAGVTNTDRTPAWWYWGTSDPQP